MSLTIITKNFVPAGSVPSRSAPDACLR